MQDDAESSDEADGEAADAAPAGAAAAGDHAMEDDSIQEFEGHGGACCVLACAWRLAWVLCVEKWQPVLGKQAAVVPGAAEFRGSRLFA